MTTLHSFDLTDGAGSYGALVQGTDGNFYGTTGFGGSGSSCGGGSGCGTVFKITAAGTLSTLHSFCTQKGCPDGSIPIAGLVQGTDGDFYGATVGNEAGTVFKITAAGVLTTLHRFSVNDSAEKVPSD